MNPVTSPVGSLTEIVTGSSLYPLVDVGGSHVIFAQSEVGIVQAQSTGGGNWQVTVGLLPNRTNHVSICITSTACITTLACTQVDRDGNPLDIVQVGPPTATATATSTATPSVTLTLTPTPTATATNPPTWTASVTATPTSCAGTPPSVDPVTSPVDSLTESVTGFSPYLLADEGGTHNIFVSSEAGVFQAHGTGGGDWQATVGLVPNQTNHLSVCITSTTCLTVPCTRFDTHGNLLDVMQILLPTATPTQMPPVTATSTPTPSVTHAPQSCPGDCHGDGQVTVDDILLMVNIALGSTPVTMCEAGDTNHDLHITVDEILTAVNNALTECP